MGQSDIGAYDYPGAVPSENDDSDTAWHLFVGWQPLEYLAITVGYADLGALSIVGDGGEGNGGAITDEIEVTAIDLSAIGMLPLGNFAGEDSFLSRVSLFGQLGIAQASQDITFNSEEFGPFSGDSDQTNLIWGLGVNVAITEHLGTHLRYFDLGDVGDVDDPDSGHEQDWAAWGLGVTRSFGGEQAPARMATLGSRRPKPPAPAGR
jgi:hypothetical protein